MRSPRSPIDASSRPETALRGAVVLSGPSSLTPAPDGLSGALPGDVFVDDRLDLVALDAGLVVTRTHNPDRTMPSLIPWSLVECSVMGGTRTGAPRGPGQVLSLAVADEQWLGGAHAWTLLSPPVDLAPFLDVVEAGKAASTSEASTVVGADGDTATSSLPAAGVLVGLHASATRWLRSLQPGGRDPRHGLGHRRVAPVVIGLFALVLLAGSTSVSFESSASGVIRHLHVARGQDTGNRAQATEAHPAPSLPAATSAPAPAPPSLAGSAPLQSHEIFGYAPYWTLPQSSGFDVKDLTTLAYFSVDANADGTLNQSGSGWNGYESQDLVNLVDRSHAAGDRVVLTVTCFSQSSLDAITSDPDAGARLSAALIAAVAAKNLDGVNFDFEGEGSADRTGLTKLITQVSGALHAANPHWQVTMATYASAADDSSGFYDVAALAPALDGFFVMAYDMNNRASPSATAPLIGGGYNDTEALQQFTAVVPAQKVILGVPYYGYDWPTTDGTKTAQATGGETPLSDGVIAASGHPTYWDPTTDTAWTSYQTGTQWHETYFDDPTSLAMKAQLANTFHIAGLGIWALGMDGNDPSMLAALLGNAPAAKDFQAGPTSTSASASSTTTLPGPPGTGFVTTGTWNSGSVALTPITPPLSDGNAQYLGTLSRLATNDPALACLQSGPPLKVWSFSTVPGVDIAVASQPQFCATAMWTFTAASTRGAGPAPTTTTAPAPTTTTTTTGPASTTTTSTTADPSSTTTTTTGH